MLWGPALSQPYTILMWKWKLGQQQRLGLAGNWECNPSSFPSDRHPLRKGPCPQNSVKNRTEGSSLCLQRGFLGVAASVIFFNASVCRASCHGLELSSSSSNHGAPKVSEATLLCSHHTRAKLTPPHPSPHWQTAISKLTLPFVFQTPPAAGSAHHPAPPPGILKAFTLSWRISNSPHTIKLVLEVQLSSSNRR